MELTATERRAIVDAANGRCAKASAELHGLSPHTIAEQRQSAIQKMGVQKMTHAVAIALRDGIVQTWEVR